MKKGAFIKKLPYYLENIDICKVKLTTQKIFAALVCKKEEYFIVLNINKPLNQQCNSIIHELLHYHNKGFESSKNINSIEHYTHKLTKYYKKHIPVSYKKLIIQKINTSFEYDIKTGEKLYHAGKLRGNRCNSTIVEYQTP